MKVAIKFTAKINMDVIKEYMEDLGETDKNPREFVVEWVKEWGLQGLNESALATTGRYIFEGE
tara:strand:- start:384 stop:572 length:189 start_codon:yes stop_codon:yes gene_type:complete